MKVVDKLEKFYDRNLILVVEGETNYCEYMSESEKELVERLKERNNFTGKKEEHEFPALYWEKRRGAIIKFYSK